jgi:nucleotide-binding universal stress UspA family protein
MTHRILVATDLGAAAGHALERVLHLAERRRETEIHVVRICLPGDDESRARVALADHLRARVGAPRTVVPHVRIAPSIVGGIRDAAADLGAELVAVGSRGGHLLGGGVAERLLDELPIDLLVVRQERDAAKPTHGGGVIVGIDFSDTSKRALAVAAAFRGDHELALAHIVETDPHALPRVPRPEADASLDHVRERLRALAAPLPVRVHVERGEIATTLAAIAEREAAALLVVGARGRRDAGGPQSTTAAARLVRSAGAPVLVVR